MPRPVTALNTVTRKRRDGTIDYDFYFRPTGLLIGRSRDGWTKEAARERAAEMLAEEAGRSGPPPGSFGEVCALYLSSPRYCDLAPRTQQEYRDHLEIMRGMWEAVPVVGITRKVVRALHASYADRRWRGNAILRTLRLVMNFAIYELEIPGLTSNPAERIAHYQTRPREQVWSQAQIDAFLEAAADQPVMRRAFALLLYTVQRPGDVLRMARPMLFEKDGRMWIRLQQAKTKTLVDVPCHGRLEAELRRADGIDQKEENPLLVASPRGKAWLYRNFARAWDRVRCRANWRIAKGAIQRQGKLPGRKRAAERRRAKVELQTMMLGDLQRRDLRRTGMIQLAVAGATTPQIAAMSGHSIDRIQKILDTYLPRKGEVALGGVKTWEDSGIALKDQLK
jgi:integrase